MTNNGTEHGILPDNILDKKPSSEIPKLKTVGLGDFFDRAPVPPQKLPYFPDFSFLFHFEHFEETEMRDRRVCRCAVTCLVNEKCSRENMKKAHVNI